MPVLKLFQYRHLFVFEFRYFLKLIFRFLANLSEFVEQIYKNLAEKAFLFKNKKIFFTRFFKFFTGKISNT